jgi:hypothetical protein
MVMSIEENSGFVRQGSLAILPASHILASRRNGGGNDEFGLAKYFFSYLQVVFYMA